MSHDERGPTAVHTHRIFDLGPRHSDSWHSDRRRVRAHSRDSHAAKTKGGSDWLFVGRISPHKAQHDLIKALRASRSFYDAEARLHLVGTSLGTDYPRALERFSARLGVADSVNMAGAVSASVLSAYFASADVFVCASDHEGFCVPLVEAMGRGLPVVAYEAAAVEEAGGAGY